MSEHIGIVGQPLPARLVSIETVKTLDAGKLRGARRYMVRLCDNDGNILVYFTGEKPSLREHTIMFVEGTVKRHGEFEGIPQTEIVDVRFSRNGPQLGVGVPMSMPSASLEYKTVERLRILCRSVGILGVITGPRTLRLNCELPEDVEPARRMLVNGSEILRLPYVIRNLDAQTLECELGEASRA